jgi:hypothetical protein
MEQKRLAAIGAARITVGGSASAANVGNCRQSSEKNGSITLFWGKLPGFNSLTRLPHVLSVLG